MFTKNSAHGVRKKAVILGLLMMFAVSVVGCGASSQNAGKDSSPDSSAVGSTARPEAGDGSSASVAPAESGTVAPGQRVAASVVRVVDGDTIDVSYAGHTNSRVRLIGVDTPEVYGKAEPYGAEASAFTKERLKPGTSVTLEFDAGLTDKYGRLLAYVWLGEELFNETLVREGYAQLLTIQPNVKYVERFLAAQTAARTAGRGLWGGGATAAATKTTAPAPASVGQPAGAVAPSGWSCPASSPIKGNQGSNGKIYHVPGGAYYEKTNPEECFATAAAAQAAGYRASQR